MPQHDLLLHNAKVLTLDGSSRSCEAVAVCDGRISAVGSNGEVMAARGPDARILDAGGRTVVPGFFDSHAHMDREGLKLRGGLQIAGVDSVEGICAAIAEEAKRRPAGEWIVVMPMGTPPHDYVSRPEQLREGRFPTRHDLDAAAPDHSVYIRAPWGWWTRQPLPTVANSRALKIADVTRDTAPPVHTEIIKDDSGEPTGLFLEWHQAPILEYTLFQCVPRFHEGDRSAGIRHGSLAYSATGTTSIYEGHGLTPALIQAYRDVHTAGDLTVRAQLPLSVPSAAFDDRSIGDLLRYWAGRIAGRGTGDDVLRTEGICLDVGDPDLARTIALGYPYEQWAGHFYQSVPHERFVELGVLAAKLGIRVNCLVCYDLERVLRAYEAIDREVRIRDRRWVVIHVIEASGDQIRRMKELGVIATVTPNFMYMANDRFNLSKLRDRGVPIRALLDAGVPVALSTDNVPHSMVWSMWEALARWDEDSQSHLGPSDLTREEALRISVQTGHLLTWDEDTRGSIEIGRTGDLVVLEDDPLTCDLDRIRDMRVLRTFVAGKETYTAGSGS